MENKKIKIKKIKDYLNQSIAVKEKILSNENILQSLITTTEKIIHSIQVGGKVIFAGNGGSAADAQHLAAEFLGKFNIDRPPLPSIALTTNSSTISAIANDYGFKYVFSRQIEALSNREDILILISTSGNSQNLIEAIGSAKKKGVYIFCLLGNNGGKIRNLIDNYIIIESNITSIIQESHIMLGHLLCTLVENEIFKNEVHSSY